MSISSWLKETFLPSEKVAAERRLKTFGTESKTVAGVAVIGAGALAIAAPVLAAAPTIRAAVVSTGTSIAQSVISIPAKIATYATSGVLPAVKTVAATAVVAGGGLKLVPALYEETKKATEAAVPILTGEKEFKVDDLPAIGKTVGAAIGMGAIGTAAGYGAYQLLADDDTKEKVKETINSILPTDDKLPVTELPKTSSTSSLVPITPSTQVIGKEASSVTRYRKKKKTKEPVRMSQSLRINILNAKNINRWAI